MSAPFRSILILGLATVLSGCSLGKPFRPMTPSQIISAEQSRVASAAMEKGNWEEAEKKFEEAVKLNKKDAELRRHYAEALWTRGKHRESLEQLNEAAKRSNGTDASLEISFAEKYLFLGDLSRAYGHANRAVRCDPKEYRSWALRGKATWSLAERQMGQGSVEETAKAFDQARNDYYRALSLSPSNRNILLELASLQMRRNEPEYALATWQNLQELYPLGSEPTYVLQGKADAYLAMDRTVDAAACLLIAQQRFPNDPGILERLRQLEASNVSGVRR